LGSATAEWSDLYLGDGGIIYGQNNQSNTITSSATGWTFNLLLTLGGNLIIPNAGNIGSVGDVDAIAIAAGGEVTLSQTLILTDVVNAGVDTDKFLVLDATNNVDYRTGAELLSDIGGLTVTNNTNNYVLTATGTAAINGEANLTFDGNALVLTPAGAGSQDIISITPSVALDAGSDWAAVKVDISALDPATGANCTISGIEMDASGLVSTDGDAHIDGFRFTPSATDKSHGCHMIMNELTADEEQVGFLCDGESKVLSATGTYIGYEVDWDGVTRDGGAPVMKGVEISMPANYANFGASYAAKFTGDGKTVTLCDTDYGLTVIGNVLMPVASLTAYRDTNSYIYSDASGQLRLKATTHINLDGNVIGAGGFQLTGRQDLGGGHIDWANADASPDTITGKSIIDVGATTNEQYYALIMSSYQIVIVINTGDEPAYIGLDGDSATVSLVTNSPIICYNDTASGHLYYCSCGLSF